MIKRLTITIAVILIHSAASAELPDPICRETPNGVVVDYYPNGKIKTEWNCKEGRLNGITRLYYENGNLEKESNYVNDVRQAQTSENKIVAGNNKTGR